MLSVNQIIKLSKEQAKLESFATEVRKLVRNYPGVMKIYFTNENNFAVKTYYADTTYLNIEIESERNTATVTYVNGETEKELTGFKTRSGVDFISLLKDSLELIEKRSNGSGTIYRDIINKYIEDNKIEGLYVVSPLATKNVYVAKPTEGLVVSLNSINPIYGSSHNVEDFEISEVEYSYEKTDPNRVSYSKESFACVEELVNYLCS